MTRRAVLIICSAGVVHGLQSSVPKNNPKQQGKFVGLLGDVEDHSPDHSTSEAMKMRDPFDDPWLSNNTSEPKRPKLVGGRGAAGANTKTASEFDREMKELLGETDGGSKELLGGD